MDNASPTSNSLAIYYKTAGTGEPASYAWTVSGSSFSVGGIRTFTGIDTANPIDVENGQSTPSSLTHVAPAVTSSTANSMLVASHAFASSRTWTPPSGMTEAFDKSSGGNSPTGLAIEGSYSLQAVAGNSGNKTATAAGDADAGNAHLLALRPKPAQLVIARPAGTVQWDLMIAAIAFNNATAVITTPGGWTLIRRINNSAGTSNSLAIYRRFADTIDGPSYAWDIAGGAFLVGGIQSFSGVDQFNPWDAESGQSTPSGTAHDTPSITTVKPNAMLVTTHTYASSQTWTPQVGLTESFDRPNGSASATGQSITGGRQLQPTPGSTGTKRSTAATSADVGNTHILALRPFTNQIPVATVTTPADGASFTAPANVTVTATASDDGTIQRVVLNIISDAGFAQSTELTSPPYTTVLNNLPVAGYTVWANVYDNEGAYSFSDFVWFEVTAAVAQQLHFIHVDHLDTPRLIANQSGQTVWRWYQQEPFGLNGPDENPSGLGAFEFPLRFPGQYADKETNLHYNYFRDYDPSLGRYTESDPIGLRGGVNTYAYVNGSPISFVDPLGLKSRVCCRRIPDLRGFRHCYIEQESGGRRNTFGLFGGTMSNEPSFTGNIRPDDLFDTGGDCGDWVDNCYVDQCVRDVVTLHPNPSDYLYTGPNSNTFAGDIARWCKLPKPKVPRFSTPGYNQEPSSQKEGESYRPPSPRK